MRSTIATQGTCPTFLAGVIPFNAVMFCASGRTSATCQGDSGAALVSAAVPHVLLGIVVDGMIGCPAGSDSIFTYVAAPEILRFLRGDAHLPYAPRGQDPVVLSAEPPVEAGQTLRCSPGSWAGRGHITYIFASDRVLQQGAQRTFVVPASAVGQRITCRLAVHNAGGTTLVESDPSPVVEA